MNDESIDVERELTERLRALAPSPRPGGFDRAIARIARTSQRGRWSSRLGTALEPAALVRMAAAGAVVATAVIVGVMIGRLGSPTGADRVPPQSVSAAPPATEGASPSGMATPSEAADGPVTQSTEQHGIRLTVTLDSDRTSFGQRLWAEATVENIGSEPAWWRHLGMCPWPVEITVAPEEPTPLDEGRDDWPGNLGIFKGVLTPEPIVPDRRRWFVAEERVDTGNMGCFAVLVNEQLPEGASVGNRAAWDTDDYMGMPPAPGRYTVEATFELWRGAGPEGPPHDTEPMTVRVAFPLVVEGLDVDWITPELAADALLADDRFAGPLADLPRERWGDRDIAFEDATWVISYVIRRAGTEPPVPEATVIGVVDARSAEVLEVRTESATP